MTRQHDITLRLIETTRPATRVGNNAAWMCPCGRDRPLLGSLMIGKGLVACPDCDRRYQLIGRLLDSGKRIAGRVEEIATS